MANGRFGNCTGQEFGSGYSAVLNARRVAFTISYATHEKFARFEGVAYPDRDSTGENHPSVSFGPSLFHICRFLLDVLPVLA